MCHPDDPGNRLAACGECHLPYCFTVAHFSLTVHDNVHAEVPKVDPWNRFLIVRPGQVDQVLIGGNTDVSGGQMRNKKKTADEQRCSREIG
jgi:hypothetical protein